MEGARTVIFKVHDRHGRQVMLTADRWDHIIERHPEIADVLPDLMIVMQDPYDVLASDDPDEEWYYLKKVGPSRWLKVIVVWESRWRGRIITAFPRREKP